jgi:hypothetical protein
LCNDNYLPIINEITDKIENYVFPMFFDLETREKVIENRLKYWEKYKEFELANSFVYNLETAMIYGYFEDVVARKILCKPPESGKIKLDDGGFLYGEKRTERQQQTAGDDGGIWRQNHGGCPQFCEDADCRNHSDSP